jgi:hypothetical protein
LGRPVHNRILVAIETDATRYHGEFARRPKLLDKTEAEQMLAHLATDLSANAPEIRSCALSLAGALFDQTQLLRPGYPVHSSLESLLEASYRDQPFEPRLLSIGSESGRMPEAALQPSTEIPLGLLQTLPLVVSGEPELIGRLSDEMEHSFLERGQLSAHSARALEANFGIAVNHARFMTITDLNAMLRLQLEHFGFLPLWELIDAAVNRPGEALSVEGSRGQEFQWNGKAVRAVFHTFDHWAGKGPGKSRAPGGQMLASEYSDWTREYRQYLTTLAAHGVPVEQVLPGQTETALRGSFMVERSSNHPARDSAPVTEHSSGDLGTVAVTVVRGGEQFNYYPLLPAGLNDLHAEIRQSQGKDAALSFPGSLLYDETARVLRPDGMPAGGGA